MWFLALITLAATIAVGAAFVGIVWALSERLSPDDAWAEARQWLGTWALQGVIGPFVIWALFNCGFLGFIQPLLPSVQAARNSGSGWFLSFAVACCAGMFGIASYWAAGSLGWILFRTSQSVPDESRSQFRGLCITSLCALAVPAAAIVWLGGWGTLGFAVLLTLLPAAGYAPAILKKPKQTPMYARAIAKMKFGKYSEAELEIIDQLERCGDDFDGWLMLAKLYAEEFHDLAEAEQLIMEICDQPGVTPSNVSVALHKLADWHLNLAENPEAARRALQVIVHRMPGTHLAHMAQVRMRSLPVSREELVEQRTNRPVALPALSDSVLDPEFKPADAMPRSSAETLAHQYGSMLKQNPQDTATREKLAHLLAENLGRAEQAIAQSWALFNQADAEPSKRAEWLANIAGWQLRFLHDRTAAIQNLERLTREFPGTASAHAAAHRLRQLAEQAAPPPLPPRPKIRVQLD